MQVLFKRYVLILLLKLETEKANLISREIEFHGSEEELVKLGRNPAKINSSTFASASDLTSAVAVWTAHEIGIQTDCRGIFCTRLSS